MSDWDWERKKLGRWRLRFGVSEVCVQRGCGGTSAAKLSLLNPPESGFGTSCCSPRGNGKWDCCKSMFCMKCPITVTSALGDKSLLLVWDLQEENCSLQQHASSLDLIPAPSSLFFPLYQYLWECRETFLYMFEHEFYPQTEPGSSLFAPVMHPYCTYSCNWEASFPKHPWLEMVWLLDASQGTAYPKIGPVIVRKVPAQFSLTEMQKFSFIPLRLEISAAWILMLEGKNYAASRSWKSENAVISMA